MGMSDVEGMNALFVHWPEIVGEQLAMHCKPKAIRDQVLTIEATDQQWATELGWMKSLLIERCCDALGDEAVIDVKIRRPRPGK